MCIRDRAYDVVRAKKKAVPGVWTHYAVTRDAAGFFHLYICLLYTSDAADERSSVDLGGRRIIKKKNRNGAGCGHARE